MRDCGADADRSFWRGLDRRCWSWPCRRSLKAQSAQVAGSISDESGGRLPGVVVELTAADGAARRVDSDASGSFRFDGVPAGPGPTRLPARELRRRPARRRRAGLRHGHRRRRDEPVAHRRRHRDRQVHLHQPRRRRAAGREPGRDRPVGQPGRDHRPSARGPAGDAHRRGARDRAGADHQPAQRRGEGQPVLPARVQPRPRHRLRRDRRRHAGEHADPRPRPRLLRSQLPDPRAGQRRAVLARARTSPSTATSPPPGPATSTTRTAWPGRSSASAAAGRVSPGRWPRRRRPPAAARCSAPSRCSTTTGRGSGPTTTSRSTACSATPVATRATAIRSRCMGYDGDWNATDQVPRRAVDDGALDRFGSLDTSDGGDSYRYSGSFDWQRTANNASTRVTAYGIAYDLNLFSNFTYGLDDPDNGDQFHQADHRVRLGRAGQPSPGRAVGQPRLPEHRSACRSATTPSRTSGCYHTVRREPLETVRQDEVLQTSGGALRAERAVVDAVAADAGGRPRGRLPVRRRGRRAGQFRHCDTPGWPARSSAR